MPTSASAWRIGRSLTWTVTGVAGSVGGGGSTMPVRSSHRPCGPAAVRCPLSAGPASRWARFSANVGRPVWANVVATGGPAIVTVAGNAWVPVPAAAVNDAGRASVATTTGGGASRSA